MNYLKTLVAAALLVVLPTTFAFSQHLKDPNAALRYMMIIGYMPEISKNEEAKLAEVVEEESYKKLPDSLVSKIREATLQRTLDLLRFAAECADCNFMPDHSYKPTDYIPPYRTFRRLARYLNAGAWYSAHLGNHEEAANLMVSTFRFGDHSENYGPMIGYMIGLAVRGIAFESMKNFLAGNYRPEAKKIITDYLKALPRPALKVKNGIVSEMKLSENILKDLSSSEEGLIELMKQLVPEEELPKAHKQPSSCIANQRVLMGALEMAAMDEIKFEIHEFEPIQEILLKEQYIGKSFICPDKGTYKVEHYLENGNDRYRISCSCGADPKKPQPAAPKTEAAEPQNEKLQQLKEKALAYKSSGQLEKDIDEFLKYYQTMIDLDVLQEGALAEIEKIQKDHKGRDNQLIKHIAIDFVKVFERQINFQKDIDTLLKQ